MDEFILMADELKELQDSWEQKEGDLYYIKTNLYLSACGCHLTPVRPREGDLEQVAQYQAGKIDRYNVSLFGFYSTRDGFKCDSQTLRKHVTFLPTQEWIQEELLKNGTVESVSYDFFSFIFSKRYGNLVDSYDFNSLWLLLYAKEKFGLIWDSFESEWIDIKDFGGE